MTAVARAGLLAWLKYAVLGLALVLLGLKGWELLVHGLLILPDPNQLDYGEGMLMNQVRLLMLGQTPYPDLRDGTYIIGNYPPFYPLVSGAVSALMGSDYLFAGRLVSLSATLACALLIASIIAHIAAGCERGLRLLAAAAGGLMFLAMNYVYYWSALMRVDMLALMLSLIGMRLFLAGEGAFDDKPGRGWLYAALVAFFAAAFTRQTSLVAALACLAAATWRRPRLGLRLSVMLALSGLGSFVIVNRLLAGQFFFHLVTANRNHYYWYRVGILWKDLLTTYPQFLVLPGLFLWLFRMRADRGRLPLAALILCFYLGFGALGSLLFGKIGANYNYVLDLLVALSLGMGACLVWMPQNERFRAGFGLVSAVLLLSLALVKPHDQLRNLVKPHDEEYQMVHARLRQLIADTPGPMISEDMALLVMAGKAVSFDPFGMTQIGYQELWDQTPMLNQVYQGGYSLLILSFELGGRSASLLERFSPEMLALMESKYQLRLATGRYYVYTPR